ncbi:MAG: hypothetical protein IPO21_21655 [Bacteroidales bacterium]|nr:hypothetical protein [Bacteroidales bacterium]
MSKNHFKMGVTVKSTGGLFLLRLPESIIGGQATVDGSLSSQMLSRLLIACH